MRIKITAPAFTHTHTCDREALGCALENVRDALRESLYHSDELPTNPLEMLEYIESAARGYQADGTISCDCAVTALHRVEASLRTVRKRERALRDSPAFGSRDYSIVANRREELLAERAAIRDELAR